MQNTGINLQTASHAELAELIAECTSKTPEWDSWPYAQAREFRKQHYGHAVYLRGLIETTSYCRWDCLYCGLRKSNRKAVRYRLEPAEVLSCCNIGYALGLRTFVLQGGEDAWFTDDRLCHLVDTIKTQYPDCAVTLSFGERSKQSYQALRRAGADRYLLRHESADPEHYASLHTGGQTLASRQACLYALKETGFQTGAGFMVGSPGQTPAQLAQDLLFLRELQPEMVGIGPFIPHEDTPYRSFPSGSLEQSIAMLALVRLLLPKALLPATTALASIHPHGRQYGFFAGANVVMPNLSPPDVRDAYALYNNKRHSGTEAAEGLHALCREMESCRLYADFSRGDAIRF